MLVDLGLPGMDGCEVARRARRIRELREVVAGRIHRPRARRRPSAPFEAGFDHHLTKPVDPAALRELLAIRSRSRRAPHGAVPSLNAGLRRSVLTIEDGLALRRQVAFFQSATSQLFL